MNVRSVLTSGVAAGFVIILCEIVLVPIIGDEMDLVLRDRGLPALSGGAMTYFGIMSLLLGIFIVWLYAAVLPRLGPGVKTSIVVSTIVWFFTYFWSNASMVAYGFMPVRITFIGTLWGLLELVLAGIVGARLYKERV